MEQGGEGDERVRDSLLFLSQVTVQSIIIVPEMGNAGESQECSEVVERVQSASHQEIN